jgi:hypothetical protein
MFTLFLKKMLQKVTRLTSKSLHTSSPWQTAPGGFHIRPCAALCTTSFLCVDFGWSAMGPQTLTLFLWSVLLIFCCVGTVADAVAASQHAAKLQGCSGHGCFPTRAQLWQLQDGQLTGQHATKAALFAAAGAAAPQPVGQPQAALGIASGSRWLQPQQRGTHSRRQLLQVGAEAAQGIPDASSPAMQQWLQDSKQYATRFNKGSCFEDYPGFIAKDITGGQPMLGCSVIRAKSPSAAKPGLSLAQLGSAISRGWPVQHTYS